MFDLKKAQRIFIAVGYTDLRQGIDGFVTLVQNTFHMNPQTSTLFIFCGRRSDRIKALFWDGDGYLLLYKRLEDGRFDWPRTPAQAACLTPEQYHYLLIGLNPLKPKIKQVKPQHVY